LPIPVDVQTLEDDRCTFEPGSDHPQMLALYLGMLDADFEIVDSPELVDALRELAARYQRAVDTSRYAG
jgi:cytochrome oxidase Cu insertion factor (SCO1/SenC/PrrC family)